MKRAVAVILILLLVLAAVSNIYRASATELEGSDLERVHGIDERISL